MCSMDQKSTKPWSQLVLEACVLLCSPRALAASKRPWPVETPFFFTQRFNKDQQYIVGISFQGRGVHQGSEHALSDAWFTPTFVHI